MLALDLGVFHRKSHVVSTREAMGWTFAWVTMAMLFNLGIWHYAGPEKALQFTAGYLIEYSLSIDNIFVFALLFSYFAVPPQYQHRVLFWGILGALIMRAIMIAAGSANPNFFKNSDPLEYGMTDLIKGIRSGKNEKALKLLSDKDKQFFFGEGLQSQGDALIFMRKMIWLSSKKENRNYQETWVSPNCDCAVLNYSKGFMWIGKTLSPKKTQTAN